MATPTFEPTTLRGHALLRHVLEVVEAEARGDGYGDIDQISKAGHWDQGTWGEIDAEELIEAGVDFAKLAVEAGGESGRAVDLTLPTTPLNLCGTACCFAGHTALQVGDRPVVNVEVDHALRNDLGSLTIMDVRPVDNPDVTVSVSTRAMDLLGLDHEEADVLFEANNTLADLRVMVDWICSGRTVDECPACGQRPWDCDQSGEACEDRNEHLDDCECCADCGAETGEGCTCYTCMWCSSSTEEIDGSDCTCQDDDDDEAEG
ncbi:hypothetical protein SEA_WOOPER_76 [Gordonia phage Wooper]|nr:hypothetical protein SEA_WOOPER_76 [Gordonia phage Wooper]